jgi:hypothetical protein
VLISLSHSLTGVNPCYGSKEESDGLLAASSVSLKLVTPPPGDPHISHFAPAANGSPALTAGASTIRHSFRSDCQECSKGDANMMNEGSRYLKGFCYKRYPDKGRVYINFAQSYINFA